MRRTASAPAALSCFPSISLSRPQLVRIWGFEATAADLRAYATLLWVAKTLLTGYVIVSLQQKQSVAAVSLMERANLHLDCDAYAVLVSPHKVLQPCAVVR